MARVNITIPDKLLEHAREAGLNVSRVAAKALSDELNRLSKLAQLDSYLAELEAERGPVSANEMAEGEEWADRVLGPRRTGDSTVRRSA